MSLTRRGLLGTATLGTATLAGAGTLLPRRSRAQGQTVRIGVLNDMSGPYRETGGMTSVVCVRQALADFGQHGFAMDVIFADHQNKPDVGAGIARQWYDRDGVDLIVDVPNSAVGLAVAAVAKEKNKAYINAGAATTELTGGQCSPTTIHWSYDTYMLARSTGGAMVKAGGDSWYFLTADYAFGQQLQRDTTNMVTKNGGKVLGASAYPFPGTTDFSSFLVSAASSGAKVLGLANAGADTVNSIKQANEFGVVGKMKIAALLMYISDVHALGLDVAKGLSLTESFYWDLNDKTRAFTNRVRAQTPNNMPNMNHAGSYSGSLHFLKAVADMGVAAMKADGKAVIERMKAMPVSDDCYQGSIRQDGRGLFASHLFQVKAPGESKGPWDYYKLVATTPAAEAWKPLAEGGCPFIRA